MGYPTSWRAPRPSRGPLSALPDMPPLEPLPWLAGLSIAAWSFSQLAIQLAGLFETRYRQVPGSYGWTLTVDCGRPQLRLPAASFGSCSSGYNLIISKSAWESDADGLQNPLSLTTTSLSYYDKPAVYNAALLRYQSIATAARWTKGTGRPFSLVTAGYRPIPALLGGPLANQWRRVLGQSDRGYANEPGAVSTHRPYGRHWRYADLWLRDAMDVHDEDGAVTHPTVPVSVPRAVPYPGMKEKKLGAHTRGGRLFLNMYRAFNFLGDSYGFTRAVWRSLPGNYYRRTPPMHAMWRDVYARWDEVNWVALLRNVALWKFTDTVMGSVQASMFNAQTAAYGANAARLWSTLDTAIRQSAGSLERASRRSQSSARY